MIIKRMTRSCRQNIVVDEYDDHTKNFSFMLKKGGERLGTYQAVVSAMERGKADSRIRAFLEKIERLESECAGSRSAIKT